MGYLPGLDGLRAIAIIGVLLYHADLDWMPGGFLGVDVFFVLSGFLITSLVLEELDRSGRLNFSQFYLRRARRLLPALLLMLVIVGAACAFIYRDAARAFLGDAIASLFYVTNWWFIAQEMSYFEAIGRPQLLSHLWSLAVEEQFYLVWPAIAVLAARWWGRRGVALVAITGAVASTAWMAILATANGYPELADPSRAYFGTDAHAMGLLVGAALACVWRPGLIRADLPSGAKQAINAAGVLGVAGILAFYLWSGEFSPSLYRGGFLVLAIVVAATIAAVTHSASALGPLLGRQPLRWLGQRSYGIYLWHWPVFMVLRPGLDTPLDGTVNLIVRLTVTLGIAELSFRFVEMPIRRGAIARTLKEYRASTGELRAKMKRIAIAAGAAAVATLVLITALLATAPAPSTAVPADVAAAIGLDDGGPTEVVIAPSPGPSAAANPSEAPAAEPVAVRNGSVSVIGDSVVLGARGAITAAIPGAKVDAAVARMPGAFVGPIKRLVRKNQLAPVVVVHPGTNGVLPESILRNILDPLRDYKVVLVNSDMPRSWRKANNATIAKVAPDYPNVTVADWYSLAKDNDSWFVSDGIHLSKEGAAQFAALIKSRAGL
jgi:peptidoglycan/LPS O-acetylase OafA/YrhL